MKNKIGWCNLTFNPVWGCLNHCEYCYARKIAKRFWEGMLEKEFYYHYYDKENPNWVWTGLEGEYTGMDKFKPVFLKSQFNKKLPKKPQRIFVGSMSEVAYWREEWVEKVIEKVKQYPQHIFQFLTRYPEVYDRHIFPKNCWLGVTITREKDFERGLPCLFITSRNIIFISVEPILEYINPGPFSNANIDWVIIGAETGNRKDKVTPEKEWIKNIVDYCKDNKIPIYLKDNLKEIYPEEIKMFPEVK